MWRVAAARATAATLGVGYLQKKAENCGIVGVVGEAGVGKTRLIWELEKYLDGLPETFHWRKGRCYSYASAGYSPLVEAKILQDRLQ